MNVKINFSRLNYFEKWFILGLILGILVGVIAIIFYFSINIVQHIFLNDIVGITIPKPLGEKGSLTYSFKVTRPYLIPAVALIGGLVSSILVYTFAPEAQGSGTEDIVHSYHNKQGKLRGRIAPVKLIASSFVIGTGGSAGSEGPIAQISSSLASLLFDSLGLSPEDRRRAVAVAMGAGIGTIFKTPIAGALLSAELLYKRDIEPDVIYPSLIASAIGYSIFGSITGFEPIFGYYLMPFNPLRIPMYAVLGLYTGFIAILYVKIFNYIRNNFIKIRINRYLKPVMGMMISSIIALFFPEIMGEGFGWVNLVMYGKFSEFPILGIPTIIIIIIILPYIKIISTSFTVGSGASGGVFTPGLFIGAFAGASIGILFHYLFPSIVPYITPFVIIGMLSTFGAAAKAPISVMLMVIEMTGGLQLLPGAMVAIAISYLISGEYTVISSQVSTRKESPAHKAEYEIPLLMDIKISEIPLKNIAINVNDSVEKALKLMSEYDILSLPVIDDGSNFIGIVRLLDIENKRKEERVSSYIIRGSPYVDLRSSAEDAWEVMSKLRSRWAPVVEKGKFKGIVFLEDILNIYKAKLNEIREQ